LVAYIRDLFVADSALADVWIAGEISEITQSAAGHTYFTIRDQDARVPAVMFKSALRRQTLPLVPGYQALVHGAVGIYEPRSQFQLVADMVLPGDAGRIRAEFEALRARLEREGLFAPERKRPLPAMPRRIGVVASESSAVLHDMINVWSRRFRGIELVLAPAAVQGVEAPRQVVEAIGLLNEFYLMGRRLDVIIVARGGGSPEELAVFNDERVARAIFGSAVPVVSAIGHEVDYTIADLVADVRAPTPSAAAELVVPDEAEVRRELNHLCQRMESSLHRRIAIGRGETSTILGVLARRSPARLIDERRRAVDDLVGRARRAADAGCALARSRVARQDSALGALSPLSTLGRGYALCTRETDGSLVTDASQVGLGDRFGVRLTRGHLRGEVIEGIADGSGL
jgi:exodeoxyribonuclease VII large subunit